MIESDQPTQSYGWVVQDENFDISDQSEVGEIFSRIEISSKLDIQGAEDRKEDTKSTHFSFYPAFSQIARD